MTNRIYRTVAAFAIALAGLAGGAAALDDGPAADETASIRFR